MHGTEGCKDERKLLCLEAVRKMKKSPCEKCYLESECCLMCNRWKAWFTRRWIEIQMVAFKNKDVEETTMNRAECRAQIRRKE